MEPSTRDSLIETAYSLFVTQGYHGTSMRNIAEHAGVAVSGMYNHFKNKEAIHVAVIERYHPFMHILPGLEDNTAQTVRELLQESIHRVVDAYYTDPNIFSLLFIEAIEFEGQHLPALYDVMSSDIEAWGAKLAEAEGTLRTDSLPMLFQWLMTVMFACFANDKLSQHRLSPEAHRNLLTAIYLDGILDDDH